MSDLDLFVHQTNLERYRKLIAATDDAEQRRHLQALLEAEESAFEIERRQRKETAPDLGG